MNLLSIGGSDPSAGAGIQSDIKVFSSLNVHCLTVVTAVTAQNTSSFRVVEPVSQKILNAQLKSVLDDFKIDGIKIGMVYDSQTIKELHHHLEKLSIPIVLDPVIRSTTGGSLIKKSAIKDFQKFLIPLATVITPNKHEVEILSQTTIKSKNQLEKAARIIQKMGAKNVIITGIPARNDQISDHIFEEKNKSCTISSEKIPGINHGSGCNFSAAILYALSNNRYSIAESARYAKLYTYNSIKNAKKAGKGITITDTTHDMINSELANAINQFANIKNIHKHIPECQTNFVYSKPNPTSTNDIMGVAGRIVLAKKNIIIAGSLEYGGSKHVATALLAVNKKFPNIRSAVNLRYQNQTILHIKKSKMTLSSYDRYSEPENTKSHHSTIHWGTNKAIRNLTRAPDAVYHKGDFGKEPMIILFGKTPKDVLKKISKITQLHP